MPNVQARPALALLIPLLLASACLAQSPSGSSAAQTWITDVTILSPENLDHPVTGTVIIADGRILRIDRSRKSPPNPPAGATVISGKGQFLIPGLIDSHVHLVSVPGMNTDQHAGKEQLLAAYYRQLPRSYLYYGYTAVVDLAVYNEKALADFRNAPLHPDLYHCGPPIPIANGYPMSFWPPAERFRFFPNFLYDPAQAAAIPAEYQPADHTPAADVARVKN